jgi:hypothetical protein
LGWKSCRALGNASIWIRAKVHRNTAFLLPAGEGKYLYDYMRFWELWSFDVCHG